MAHNAKQDSGGKEAVRVTVRLDLLQSFRSRGKPTVRSRRAVCWLSDGVATGRTRRRPSMTLLLQSASSWQPFSCPLGSRGMSEWIKLPVLSICPCFQNLPPRLSALLNTDVTSSAKHQNVKLAYLKKKKDSISVLVMNYKNSWPDIVLVFPDRKQDFFHTFQLGAICFALTSTNHCGGKKGKLFL